MLFHNRPCSYFKKKKITSDCFAEKKYLGRSKLITTTASVSYFCFKKKNENLPSMTTKTTRTIWVPSPPSYLQKYSSSSRTSSVAGPAEQQTSPGVESVVNCQSCELESQFPLRRSRAERRSYRASAPALLARWLAAGEQGPDQSDDGTVGLEREGEGRSAHWFHSLSLAIRLFLGLQRP